MIHILLPYFVVLAYNQSSGTVLLEFLFCVLISFAAIVLHGRISLVGYKNSICTGRFIFLSINSDKCHQLVCNNTAL